MPEQQNVPQSKPQTVMTMEQMIEVIKALKAPSEEEQQKIDEAKEAKRQMAIASREAAETNMKGRLGFMRMCSHRNPRNHTWIANVMANGDCIALCQICNKNYRWKATDEQK